MMPFELCLGLCKVRICFYLESSNVEILVWNILCCFYRCEIDNEGRIMVWNIQQVFRIEIDEL